MSENDLTKEEREELEKLQKEIIDEAKKVIKDYADNPSELSGSAIHIDYDSTFLDEEWKNDQWKNVTKPEFITNLTTNKNRSDNMYQLVLKSTGEQIDRIVSENLNSATDFYIKRKQMDTETFHKLYEVKKED